MTTVFLPFLFILTSALAPPQDVTLGQEFDVRVGRWVTVEGERLRVTFDRVAEDSRCPEGVNCIWAGNVRVALLVKGPGKAQRREKLNTATEPRELKLNGRTVTISKVSPAKVVEREIKTGSYRITLSLAPRGPN